MANYTSNQYKYLLLQRLRRDLSMPDPSQRAHTYNFFIVLFDGIPFSKESYELFINKIEEMEIWASANNIRRPNDAAPQTTADSLKPIIAPLFATIGIKAEMVLGNLGLGRYQSCTFNFEKPDGTKLSWGIHGNEDDIYHDCRLNYRAGAELDYATFSASNWALSNLDLSEADKLDPHVAGKDCYWKYEAETNTVRVEGTGAFAGVVADEQLGCGQYDTLIIGSNITRLLANCVVGGIQDHFPCTQVVVLVPADQPLIVDDNQFERMDRYKDEYKRVIHIYTDHESIRKTYISSDVQPYIVFHSLSEWTGE